MSTLVAAKDPDVAATYEIDVFEAFVLDARRSYDFELNDVTRAPRDTGLLYLCTQAGRTASYYPVWPRRPGENVVDGSVEWESKHPDDASPPEIADVDWTLPADLTLDAQSHSEHIASVTIAGGTAGVDYDVTARITPNSGEPVEITITIPVREL
jgi:hypothetical protein